MSFKVAILLVLLVLAVSMGMAARQEKRGVLSRPDKRLERPGSSMGHQQTVSPKQLAASKRAKARHQKEMEEKKQAMRGRARKSFEDKKAQRNDDTSASNSN
ncbi:Uncharacterized protein PBTT_04523 [Plasmodiophora brassicae]